MDRAPGERCVYLMGIDIGTTSTRTVVIDDAGVVVASEVAEYGLSTPRPLWCEQDPADWWRAAIATIRGVCRTIRPDLIRCIGLTGQMHGLVLLNAQQEVLRPAILWNDQRTREACAWITERVGLQALVAATCNPVLTGFTAGKLIWTRDSEPQVFARIRRVLLPKDYVRFRLTGEFATDVSDASGTSLLDVPERRWSDMMLRALEFDRAWLPDVLESCERTGAVSKPAAQETGLRAGTPVVAGGGDQAAGAVGAGIVHSGKVSVSLGTSGVVFAHSRAPTTDPKLRTHTFCHAVPNNWHLMGVVLSAGGSLRWWRDAIAAEESARARACGRDPYDEITQGAQAVPAGSEGLVFLPYLTGERTPHADPFARGAFVGLTLRHGRAHLARAVMEGVAFALNDSLAILRENGVPASEIRIIGGGARSTLWRQILADVFRAPLVTLEAEEGPAYGAALLAGVGCGLFSNVEEACQRCVHPGPITEPVAATAQPYAENYARFSRLYDGLRDDFAASAPG